MPKLKMNGGVLVSRGEEGREGGEKDKERTGQERTGEDRRGEEKGNYVF